jgi:hypothetical protein
VADGRHPTTETPIDEAGGKALMLTFVGLGFAIVLILVAFFMYSSRNKKAPPSPNDLTATDRARDPDRKRASGAGED